MSSLHLLGMEKHDFYSASISLDNQQNILTVKFKDNIEVDVKEITILVDESIRIVDGRKFYLLVDARDILSSMDRSARKYFAEHEEYNRLNIAQAIVVNNMPTRLLAMAYYKFYQHQNPVKIFTDLEKAKQWLLEHSYPL